MKRNRHFLLFLLLGVFIFSGSIVLSGCGGSSSGGGSSPASSSGTTGTTTPTLSAAALSGQATFKTDCSGCHPVTGSTAGAAGAPALTLIGSTLSPTGLGIAVNSMNKVMAGGSLSSTDVSNVVAYLETLTGTVTVTTTSGLTIIQTAGCLGCHGGTIAPTFANIVATVSATFGADDMVSTVMNSGVSSQITTSSVGSSGVDSAITAANFSGGTAQTGDAGCLMCHSYNGKNGVTTASDFTVAPNFSYMTPLGAGVVDNMSHFFVNSVSGSESTIANAINSSATPVSLPSGAPAGLSDMQAAGCFGCHTITVNASGIAAVSGTGTITLGPGATGATYADMLQAVATGSTPPALSAVLAPYGYVAPDLSSLGNTLSATGIQVAVNVMFAASPGGIDNMMVAGNESNASAIETYLGTAQATTPTVATDNGFDMMYTAGCLGCHTLSGNHATGFSVPGGVGPDLSTLGSTIGPAPWDTTLSKGAGSFTFIHYPENMGGSEAVSGTLPYTGFLTNAINLQLNTPGTATVASSTTYTVPAATSPYTAVITPYLPAGTYTINQVIESYMGTLEGAADSAYPYGVPLYVSTSATGAALLKETCLLCHTVVGYNGITAGEYSSTTAVDNSGYAVAPDILNGYLISGVTTPGISQSTLQSQFNEANSFAPSGFGSMPGGFAKDGGPYGNTSTEYPSGLTYSTGLTAAQAQTIYDCLNGAVTPAGSCS